MKIIRIFIILGVLFVLSGCVKETAETTKEFVGNKEADVVIEEFFNRYINNEFKELVEITSGEAKERIINTIERMKETPQRKAVFEPMNITVLENTEESIIVQVLYMVKYNNEMGVQQKFEEATRLWLKKEGDDWKVEKVQE